MPGLHIGDIGTVLEVTLQDETGAALDVSDATVMQIVLQKPDKTTVTKTAVHTTDGTNGKIQYVTVSGDIDQAKTWKIQGKVTLPTGSWSSEIASFNVEKNL